MKKLLRTTTILLLYSMILSNIVYAYEGVCPEDVSSTLSAPVNININSFEKVFDSGFKFAEDDYKILSVTLNKYKKGLNKYLKIKKLKKRDYKYSTVEEILGFFFQEAISLKDIKELTTVDEAAIKRHAKKYNLKAPRKLVVEINKASVIYRKAWLKYIKDKPQLKELGYEKLHGLDLVKAVLGHWLSKEGLEYIDIRAMVNITTVSEHAKELGLSSDLQLVSIKRYASKYREAWKQYIKDKPDLKKHKYEKLTEVQFVKEVLRSWLTEEGFGMQDISDMVGPVKDVIVKHAKIFGFTADNVLISIRKAEQDYKKAWSQYIKGKPSLKRLGYEKLRGKILVESVLKHWVEQEKLGFREMVKISGLGSGRLGKHIKYFDLKMDKAVKSGIMLENTDKYLSVYRLFQKNRPWLDIEHEPSPKDIFTVLMQEEKVSLVEIADMTGVLTVTISVHAKNEGIVEDKYCVSRPLIKQYRKLYQQLRKKNPHLPERYFIQPSEILKYLICWEGFTQKEIRQKSKVSDKSLPLHLKMYDLKPYLKAEPAIWRWRKTHKPIKMNEVLSKALDAHVIAFAQAQELLSLGQTAKAKKILKKITENFENDLKLTDQGRRHLVKTYAFIQLSEDQLEAKKQLQDAKKLIKSKKYFQANALLRKILKAMSFIPNEQLVTPQAQNMLTDSFALMKQAREEKDLLKEQKEKLQEAKNALNDTHLNTAKRIAIEIKTDVQKTLKDVPGKKQLLRQVENLLNRIDTHKNKALLKKQKTEPQLDKIILRAKIAQFPEIEKTEDEEYYLDLTVKAARGEEPFSGDRYTNIRKLAAVINRLKLIGTKASTQTLLKYLSHNIPEIREVAHRALAKLNGQAKSSSKNNRFKAKRPKKHNSNGRFERMLAPGISDQLRPIALKFLRNPLDAANPDFTAYLYHKRNIINAKAVEYVKSEIAKQLIEEQELLDDSFDSFDTFEDDDYRFYSDASKALKQRIGKILKEANIIKTEQELERAFMALVNKYGKNLFNNVILRDIFFSIDLIKKKEIRTDFIQIKKTSSLSQALLWIKDSAALKVLNPQNHFVVLLEQSI